MRVIDIMTKNCVTIEPMASLKQAMDDMERHDVRHLVVVDADGRLEGIVSDRDLLAATGWVDEPSDSRRVMDVMHRDVKTTNRQAEVVAIATEMIVDAIGCLPVVEDDHVVGIVTESDLVGAFLKALEQGILPRDADPLIATKMTRDPLCISPSDTVLEARLILRARKIRHLPVIDGDRVLGVLSDRDTRRVEGRHQLREPVLAEAIKRRVVIIAPDQRLSTAAVLMLDRKISCLPVVAPDSNKLVGILTLADLLDHCAATLWQPTRFVTA